MTQSLNSFVRHWFHIEQPIAPAAPTQKPNGIAVGPPTTAYRKPKPIHVEPTMMPRLTSPHLNRFSPATASPATTTIAVMMSTHWVRPLHKTMT